MNPAGGSEVAASAERGDRVGGSLNPAGGSEVAAAGERGDRAGGSLDPAGGSEVAAAGERGDRAGGPNSGRHDFPVRASADVHIGKIMVVRSDKVEMPGGRLAVREVVEHAGAVAIAALDADDRLMMIHQYRHAVRRRLWELPAGLLDAAGEDPLRTARRELAEEAGLAASDWSVLLDVVPSPGFSDESVRVYLARGISEVDRPAMGDDEEADLVARWVSLPVAVRMVLGGALVNGVSAAAVLAVHAWHAAGAVAGLRPCDAPWPDRPTRLAGRRG